MLKVLFVGNFRKRNFFRKFASALLLRGYKFQFYDPLNNPNHSLNEKGKLLLLDDHDCNPSLVINTYNDLDILWAIKDFSYPDKNFAYSQWLSYLPTLINSFDCNVLNPPKLGCISQMSLNGSVNRLFLTEKGISTPNEIFISRYSKSKFISTGNIITRDNNGNLYKTKVKEGLRNIKNGSSFFIENNLPVQLVFFFGIVYRFDTLSEHIDPKLKNFTRSLFGRFNMAYGICSISRRKNKFIVWNVLPLVDKRITFDDKIVKTIQDFINEKTNVVNRNRA